MGICCGKSDAAPSKLDKTAQMQDLAAPLTIGCDPIAAFERTLPFYRTAIHVMFDKINEAESASGVEGCVTIAGLRK